jgi:hypothetical protein
MCGYDVARQTDPKLYDYSSMTIEEIQSIADTFDISEPAHYNLDAVGWLKEQLLTMAAGK